MAQNRLATLKMEIEKRFPNLLESKPHGDFNIEKLECVLHAGKRMFRRLKDVKTNLTEIKKFKKRKNEKEEPAAKRKRRSKTSPLEEKRTELTGKVMKEISLFYSLAIQNNPDDNKQS
ncbi:hypothetical protein HHI36_001009 [Cryptolaemus montrouzieri]|uniref:Uncharacterized protein n=1 Tax=Cryptolaemus montrouzieri TaxID=559131 RepID=A0ABD2P663_9CUCU